MIRTLVLLLVLGPLGGLAARAGSGHLDPTFGTAGGVTMPGRAPVGALAPDGRIVLALADSPGPYDYLTVKRLNPDGGIDATFSTARIEACSGCELTEAQAVAVQSDGRIIVAAAERRPLPPSHSSQVLVVRLNVDGSLDRSFGSAGRATFQLDQVMLVDAVALQPDGRIVLAGSAGPMNPAEPLRQQRRFLARLDTSGNLDSTFDGDGATVGDYARVFKAHVRPDGRIEALAAAEGGSTLTRYGPAGDVELSVDVPAPSSIYDAAWQADGRIWILTAERVIRLMADGSPDPAFTSPQWLRGGQLALLADGTALVFGDRAIRVLADGRIDPDFGNHGELRTVAQSRNNRLARQPDGKVLAFGTGATGSSILRIDPTAPGFVGTALIEFPYQSLGTLSEPLPLTVSNTTGSSISVSVTTPRHYEHAHDCGTSLGPGAACTVLLYHRPVPPADFYQDRTSGTVTVTGGAGGPDASIDVEGYVERGLVYHFYRSVLRREPEYAGARYWRGEASSLAIAVANLAGLSTLARTSDPWYALAMTFFGSAEYASFGADDDAYLADLYRTFFDREPDAAGVAYWKDQLALGLTREGVLLQFMFSPEFTAFTETNFDEDRTRPEIATVIDFYRGLLHRLPDLAGLQYWVSEFQRAQCAGAGSVYVQAERISKQFAESAEYVRLSRDNAGYVVDLYNAFLGRAPDVAGLHFWKRRLDDNAMSRDAMRQAFMASPEFSARVQAIVSETCRP